MVLILAVAFSLPRSNTAPTEYPFGTLFGSFVQRTKVFGPAAPPVVM